MKTQTLLIFGTLLCVFVVHANASPGDDEVKKKEWMEKMKKCGDGEINVQEAFKGMEKCKQQEDSTLKASRRRRRGSDADSDDKKKEMWKKHMCTAVCAWKEQGILDTSGKFVEAGCKAHVDKVYPEKYRTDALTNMKECATNSSSTFSMDNNCSGYKEFQFCAFQAHMKTCGIKWGKMPEGDKNK